VEDCAVLDRLQLALAVPPAQASVNIATAQ
jgi:hypothetical protein